MSRKLMITVDVEAQPARAERDHVERLVWGRWPGLRSGGIGEMMEMADRHGAKIVMFLDYCERALYGEDMLDVGREIRRRGHDLQLHAHPEFLPSSFWSSRGLERIARRERGDGLTQGQADALFDYLCDSQSLAGGDAPLGYRGGGYRYGPESLRSMARHGVMLNSSYISARENQPLRRGPLRQFLWDAGCLELPVSSVNPYRNLTRDLDFNFNAGVLSTVERMMDYLDDFYDQQGEDAVAVLVMHSWSFSQKQEDGFFSPPLPENLARFDGFLAALRKEKIRVIDTAQALLLAGSGEIGLGPEIAVAELEASLAAGAPLQEPPRSPRPPRPAADATPLQTPSSGAAMPPPPVFAPMPPAVVCNICGAAIVERKDKGGRDTAPCPQCGGIERQRVLQEIYASFLKKEFDLKSRRVLALSPSNAERTFFKRHGVANLVTCDIQPSLKTDVVADVTAMPQVASDDFDAVVASFVLTCVRDAEAALKEIHRVLKPGGRLLCCDPLGFNAETATHPDLAQVTNWYGEEAYRQYGIGNFRQFGDHALLELLIEAGFTPKTFYGADPITGRIWVWHSAAKRDRTQRPPEPKVNFPRWEPPPRLGDLEQAEIHWGKGEYAEAARLHHLALAAAPAKLSFYRLGTAYLFGRGVVRDLDKAWGYLAASVNDQDRYTLYYRGLLLAMPEFSGHDRAQARRNLERAAELGVALAKDALARL